MKFTLNKLNGDIEVGDLTVKSSFSLDDLERLKKFFKVHSLITYDNGNSFYPISNLDNGESAVLFFSHKIG